MSTQKIAVIGSGISGLGSAFILSEKHKVYLFEKDKKFGGHSNTITINKDKFNKKVSESVFIPQGAIHRIENPYKVPVKILEIQTGSILKETDIVRYQDIYGRVK